MTDEGRRIVAFYEGRAPDDRGRFHEQILRFDDAQLECVHDFIQWLFPLRDRSGANPSAPRLDDGAVQAFADRPELRAALGRSLGRMMAFYGLTWECREVVRAADFEKHRHWLTPENHNHLRLTRMLISLKTLGLRDEAAALYRGLTAIAAENPGSVSARTLRFWQEAR